MDTCISPSIIMRVREFGESDILVSFFTSDRGLIKGVAKGGRRSRVRFPNCLDLFSLVDMEYRMRRRGNLYLLNSCRLVEAYPEIRSDFSSLSLAAYMVELTEMLFPEHVADSGMFELLKESLAWLQGGAKKDMLRIIFEARAMALGGFGVDFMKCCLCGRKYEGKGRAVFNYERGGIACLGCERESQASPGLGLEAVLLMKNMQSVGGNEIRMLSGSDDVIREIRAVLDRHIMYRAGRRLKSAQYLG